MVHLYSTSDVPFSFFSEPSLSESVCSDPEPSLPLVAAEVQASSKKNPELRPVGFVPIIAQEIV
jgi:hypothetical protein